LEVAADLHELMQMDTQARYAAIRDSGQVDTTSYRLSVVTFALGRTV